VKKLEESQVPSAKVNNIADLFASVQLASRNMLVPVVGEEGIKVAGCPVKYGDEPDITSKQGPPKLGQHNDEILRKLLGYPEADIQKLYDEEVIFR
jgi:crotonobetainyl-CoA:carnitine CoA-transferase CaiB-like acyl-CoA transferase